MSLYRDQVAAAVAAVAIRGRTRYAWLGRASVPLSAELEAAMDEGACRRYLVSCVSAELYWSFYRHGWPVPAQAGESEPATADPALAAALSHANSGKGGWERGWTVEQLDDGRVVVSDSRLRAWVPAADCRPEAALRPGARVALRMPKELAALSPGFHTALGNAPADAEPESGMVRAYWHVTSAGAPALMQSLTSRLNAAGVAFRLKIADHPVRFQRCDAATLYLPADAFPAVRETLLDVAARLSAHLRPRIPALTLELAPGLGLAEDDGGGGESFGVRRCGLLADGIVRAHDRGVTGLAARVRTVAERFAEDGVDMDAPYREPSLSGRGVL